MGWIYWKVLPKSKIIPFLRGLMNSTSDEREHSGPFLTQVALKVEGWLMLPSSFCVQLTSRLLSLLTSRTRTILLARPSTGWLVIPLVRTAKAAL
jgi:hypothetical protein